MFTPHEEALIRLAAKEQSNSDRLWFYVAVLVGPLVMAVYGVLRRDFIAIAVAFFALFALVTWKIGRELKYATDYRSVFRKLEASEMVGAKANDA